MLGPVDIEDWRFTERDLVLARLRSDARLRALAALEARSSGLSVRAHRLVCLLVAGAAMQDDDVDELARAFPRR